MTTEQLNEFRRAAEFEAQYPISAGRAAAAEVADQAAPRNVGGRLITRTVLEATVIALLVTALHKLLRFSDWELLAGAFCAALVAHALAGLTFHLLERWVASPQR